jgi:hypothetical protein
MQPGTPWYAPPAVTRSIDLPTGGGNSLVVVRPHGGRLFVSPSAVRDVLALIETKRAHDEE